ncbi:MAG: hypothetical protein EOP45_23210, partial [Sphingobacteriaceae bacterium]
MAACAYKSKNNNDPTVANVLISGFTGQLKGWWDYYISPENKTQILTAKKNVVKLENGTNVQTQEDDVVNTLIFAIMKSFVGDPSHFQARASETLINLNCPTLSDFRWYKDVFLTKVYTRSDSNLSFWKERFIASLPKLFADKVMNKIRSDFNNTIPY